MRNGVLEKVLAPIPESEPRRTDELDSRRLWLIRCAIGVVMGALAVQQIFGNHTPDFAVDYAAAWAYWNGRPVHAPTAELLAECWPQHEFHELTGARQSHPPFATLLALPLALLTFEHARIVWCVISVLAIVAAWQLVHARVATCLATAPIWCVALVLGTHEPLLFLLIGGAIASVAFSPRRAGALLGLAVALKAYPAVLAVGLVITRQWRCVAMMFVAAGVVALTAELVFGAGTTAEWFAFTGVITSVYVDSPDNGSLVRHLRQLIAVPDALAACLLAGALIVPLARKLSAGDAIRPLLPVALLASPLSWRHYMGLTGVLELGRVEQSCLALAGLLVLLLGMGIISPPPDLWVHVPLVLVLFFQWGRYAVSSQSLSVVEPMKNAADRGAVTK